MVPELQNLLASVVRRRVVSAHSASRSPPDARITKQPNAVLSFAVANFFISSGRDMKFLVLRILFAAIALAGLPASALAVPLLWTLNGVTFSGGGTASGSFVYDASTNTNSAVNITTTTGGGVTGSTYTFVCVTPCNGVFPNSPTYLVALTVPATTSPLTGLPLLELRFSSALTDAGGTVTLTGASFEDRCSNPNCNATEAPVRFVSAGSLTASPLAPIAPIPTPTLSNWALIVLAMLMLLVGAVAFSRGGKRSLNGR
jgi:hypothetical protein